MTLRHYCGIYCLVAAAIVTVQFVLAPLYDSALAEKVWAVVDWPIALGIIISLTASVRWRLNDTETEVTRLYLERTAVLVASVLLAVWFAWNWFAYLEGKGDESIIMWALIDPLFVLTVGACGFLLLSRRS